MIDPKEIFREARRKNDNGEFKSVEEFIGWLMDQGLPMASNEIQRAHVIEQLDAMVIDPGMPFDVEADCQKLLKLLVYGSSEAEDGE